MTLQGTLWRSTNGQFEKKTAFLVREVFPCRKNFNPSPQVKLHFFIEHVMFFKDTAVKEALPEYGETCMALCENLVKHVSRFLHNKLPMLVGKDAIIQDAEWKVCREVLLNYC